MAVPRALAHDLGPGRLSAWEADSRLPPMTMILELSRSAERVEQQPSDADEGGIGQAGIGPTLFHAVAPIQIAIPRPLDSRAAP